MLIASTKPLERFDRGTAEFALMVWEVLLRMERMSESEALDKIFRRFNYDLMRDSAIDIGAWVKKVYESTHLEMWDNLDISEDFVPAVLEQIDWADYGASGDLPEDHARIAMAAHDKLFPKRET